MIGIGDDDISEYFQPALTTVFFDYINTGEIAGNMIIDLINEKSDVEDQVIDFTIKERNSVK